MRHTTKAIISTAVLFTILASGIYGCSTICKTSPEDEWGKGLVSASVQKNSGSPMEEWGRVLKEYTESKDEDTAYLKGKTAVVTKAEMKQAIEFFMITGADEEKAVKEAVKSVTEREALYEEAVQNGFSVTDDEVKTYLEELKKNMASSGNNADVEAIIKGMGSEEEYWDYEFTVYKKDLPILKYQESLENQYKDRKVKLRLNLTVPSYEEGFDGFLERYREELAKEQNYQLVK